MTVRQLARAAARRWYVTIAGLLLTALLGAQGMQARGDYEVSASLVFLAPQSRENPNGLLAGGNIISAAGVIGATVRGDEARADLRAAGMVDDYTVELHNAGNQWADNYDRPMLDVRIRGADPLAVRQSLVLLVRRVNAELVRMQRSLGAAEVNWIRTQLSPSDPPVLHGSGSPARALAAALLLGVAGTLVLAVGVDDLVRRRARRRSDGADIPGEAPPVPVPVPATERVPGEDRATAGVGVS